MIKRNPRPGDYLWCGHVDESGKPCRLVKCVSYEKLHETEPGILVSYLDEDGQYKSIIFHRDRHKLWGKIRFATPEEVLMERLLGRI